MKHHNYSNSHHLLRTGQWKTSYILSHLTLMITCEAAIIPTLWMRKQRLRQSNLPRTHFKKVAVQKLRLCASNAGAWVSSL